MCVVAIQMHLSARVVSIIMLTQVVVCVHNHHMVNTKVDASSGIVDRHEIRLIQGLEWKQLVEAE
jgi:hypothetical protein